jgi:hypothetical protein
MVRLTLPRAAQHKPGLAISRSTMRRATSMPARRQSHFACPVEAVAVRVD